MAENIAAGTKDSVKDGTNGSKDEITSSTQQIQTGGENEIYVFNHLNCHSQDRRLLFREALLKTTIDTKTGRQVLDFDAIEKFTRRKPKLATIAYSLPYPDEAEEGRAPKTRRKKQQNRHDIYPLSRILSYRPPLPLVKHLFELHPSAIFHAEREGRLPLHFSCRFDAELEVIQYVTSKYMEAVSRPTIYGVIPLHYAAANQSVDVVRYLVEQYPDGVSSQKADGATPLHQACAFHRNSSSEQIIQYLLSRYPKACSIPTHSGTRKGILPLHLLFSSLSGSWGSHEAFSRTLPSKELMTKITDAYPDAFKTRTYQWMYPLHYACCAASWQLPREGVTSFEEFCNSLHDIIELALDGNPDAIKAQSRVGKTPLHYAMSGTMSIAHRTIRLFLQACPEIIEIKDNKGTTIVEAASKNLEEDRDVVGNDDSMMSNYESTTKRRSRKRQTVEYLTKIQDQVDQLRGMTTEQRQQLLQSIEKNLPSVVDETESSTSLPLKASRVSTERRRRRKEEQFATTGADNTPVPKQKQQLDGKNRKSDSVTFRQRRHQNEASQLEDERQGDENPVSAKIESQDDLSENNEDNIPDELVLSVPGAYEQPGHRPPTRGTIVVQSRETTDDNTNKLEYPTVSAEVVTQDVQEMQAEIEELRAKLAHRGSGNATEGTRDNTGINSSVPLDTATVTTTIVQATKVVAEEIIPDHVDGSVSNTRAGTDETRGRNGDQASQSCGCAIQ